MATDSQTLLTQSQCYACYTPGEWQLMILALLRQIALSQNPMAATDPQSLLTQAQCFQCYGGGGLWTLMQLALLAQIANGGGSGAVCILGGVGAPAAAVPCNFSAYIQQPGPNFGLWLGDLVTGWSQVITQGP